MGNLVLGVDTGYGDVKVVCGDKLGIKNIYKFPSAPHQCH